MATDKADVKLGTGTDAGQEQQIGKEGSDDSATIAEERAELDSYRSELTARYAQLDALLRDNEDPRLSEHQPFAKTDSTLKRNTAFVKKLKNYTEAQREALMRELPALNLTKYLEEVASALLEAKLRSTDLPHVLLINCLLHRNYPAYAELALDAWRKLLPATGASAAGAPTETAPAAAAAAASAASAGTSAATTTGGGAGKQALLNLAKLRIDLRLYADLVLTRIMPTLPGLKLLAQCLQFLTAGDSEFNHCGLVSHLLAQTGDSLVGKLPTRKAHLAEKLSESLPRSPDYLDPDVRRQFHRVLTEYCRRLTSALTAKGSELAQLDRGNRRILHSKGELSQDRRDNFEACKKEVDRLLGLANQLCNVLGEPAPELPPVAADDLDDEERAVADAVSAPAGAGRLPGLDEAAGGGRFEDEDARQFYEMLPDLRPMLPEVLVREARERMESSKKAAAAAASESSTPSVAPDGPSASKAEPEAGGEEATVSEEALLERELEAEEAAAAAAESGDAAGAAGETADDAGGGETATAAAADETSAATSAAAEAAAEATTPAGSQRQLQLEQFLAALPTLVNRDMIDKAAIQFATAFNSKSARRRLVQTMFSVPRSRCDLLPFYARLAAVLNPVAPEVGEDLGGRLQKDFRHAFHKKDHTNLESKLKVVRFIGELVKFGLFPLNDAASDLKLLVINFSNHSIELACAMLESCGRFMYATQDTHLRMKVYLRNLWNKKTKIVIDERFTAMIENAYYSVVPPDNTRAAKVAQLPPVMQFVQKLLFKELCNASVEKVLRLCLCLPWSDPDMEQFIIRAFTTVWSVPYGSVHCLASVLAGLAPYHQSAAIAVVDSILEDIRLGMEINAHRLNQRRVACVRYLGEMYNYCLVESGVVFNTLHSLITLGVCLGPESATAAADSPIDPPEHLQRIRLACVLLETCGQYFDSGSNRKRLDAYLLYLQQYYWYKRCHPVWSTEERPFPLDIEYLYVETVDSLRPKFKHAASFDEAKLVVAKQEKAFLAKLERVAARLRPQQASTSEHLPPIVESASSANAAATTDDDEDGGSTTEDGGDGDGDGDLAAGVGGRRRGGANDGEGGGTASQSEDEAAATSATETQSAPARPQLMACPEDEEFLRAFERTLVAETGGVPVLSSSSTTSLETTASAASHAGASVGGGSDSTVAFTVMARRGGGSKNQPVVRLPADSQLARRYLAAAEADALEREAVKRATLNITAVQMMQEDIQAAGESGADLPPPLAPWEMRRGGGGGGFRRPWTGRHY